MKTKDLIKKFEKKGWKFYRHGARHDIYKKGEEIEEIVRHRETNEKLAQHLIKNGGYKPPYQNKGETKMKQVYPVIFEKTEDETYLAFIPDFDAMTQGETFADAIDMARDAIELKGITLEDLGKKIPEPSKMEDIKIKKNQILNAVDVDFLTYRNLMESKSVRKNCTLPGWLEKKAEQAGLSYSKALQNGLLDMLEIRH